jgi:hypothetical protein
MLTAHPAIPQPYRREKRGSYCRLYRISRIGLLPLLTGPCFELKSKFPTPGFFFLKLPLIRHPHSGYYHLTT